MMKTSGTPRLLCDRGRQPRQLLFQTILGLSLVQIVLEKVSAILFAQVRIEDHPGLFLDHRSDVLRNQPYRQLSCLHGDLPEVVLFELVGQLTNDGKKRVIAKVVLPRVVVDGAEAVVLPNPFASV